MSNIVRVSLSEIASLPAHDVFLCCSSFEKRCLTVASLLSHKSCKMALICHYYGPNHKSDENFKIIIGKNTIDGSVDRVLFDAVNSTTKIVIAAMNE